MRRRQREGIHELGLDEQVGVLWAALQNSRTWQACPAACAFLSPHPGARPPGRATTRGLCSDSQRAGPRPLSRPVSCLLHHLFLSPPWQFHSNPTAQRLPHRGRGQGQGWGPQHSPADRGQKFIRSTGSDLTKAIRKARVWGRRRRSLTPASSCEIQPSYQPYQ